MRFVTQPAIVPGDASLNAVGAWTPSRGAGYPGRIVPAYPLSMPIKFNAARRAGLRTQSLLADEAPSKSRRVRSKGRRPIVSPAP